jgi:hypothetical protein
VTDTFTASWAPGVQFITLFSGTPLVGAVINNTPGIPNDTLITSISPSAYPPRNGYTILINKFTTANQPIPGSVEQTYTVSNAQQPINNYLEAQFQTPTNPPFGNDFTIQSPTALIYGYINRIIISQIQVQCNIPTVNYAQNDRFYIVGVADNIANEIVIAYGFYYPDELAALLEVEIASVLPAANIQVTYNPRDGFVFESTSSPPVQFYFPDLDELKTTIVDASGNPLTPSVITIVLKTCKLLGMTVENSSLTVARAKQVSTQFPNFLYTPYIDFYSDVLTNYQVIKDTDTSATKRKGLLARVYLSGSNTVQTVTATAPGTLGCAPFTVTADLNTPKVIRWTPEVAVPSIDFQLRDCYGDLLPGYGNIGGPNFAGEITAYGTEFQMTVLCIEGSADY